MSPMEYASYQDAVGETPSSRVLTAQGSNPEAPATKTTRSDFAADDDEMEATGVADGADVEIDAARVETQDGITESEEDCGTGGKRETEARLPGSAPLGDSAGEPAPLPAPTHTSEIDPQLFRRHPHKQPC